MVDDRDFNMDSFIVIWKLTRACQLKCLHCRAEAQYHRDPLELTFEEEKKLVAQIYDMNNPLLVFTGGDPLTREDVYDIAEYAINKGVRVSMTPSATPIFLVPVGPIKAGNVREVKKGAQSALLFV